MAAIIPSILLYGTVKPGSGEISWLQFSHVDTRSYQWFLEAFSKLIPIGSTFFKSIMDGFTSAKILWSQTMSLLLLQPPYSPEFNPIERLWENYRVDLKWAAFKTLDPRQDKVDQLLAA